jgi:hypothetical protein
VFLIEIILMILSAAAMALYVDALIRKLMSVVEEKDAALTLLLWVPLFSCRYEKPY